MRAMGDAMRLGTDAGVQLLRPFIALHKGQIAAEGARLGVDFARTWSCYKGLAFQLGAIEHPRHANGGGARKRKLVSGRAEGAYSICN